MSDRPHGTHNCYVHGPDRSRQGAGCRCEPCRHANKLYERERARRIEPPYVDATEAREHLKALAAAGIGLKSVARITGLSHGSLSKLVYGDGGRGTPPSKRIRPATRDAILRVATTDGPVGTRVPAGPVHADVATLLERGWTKTAIAKAIGQRGPGLQLGGEYVTRRHAATVHQLLDQPVPPRRSRHGLHPVPQPDLEAERVEQLRTEARREKARTDRAAYRAKERGIVDEPPRTLADLLLPQPWRRDAACRLPHVPPSLFFPGETDAQMIAAAKAVCTSCPVAADCLAYALDHDEHGVWGGLTDTERAGLSVEAVS